MIPTDLRPILGRGTAYATTAFGQSSGSGSNAFDGLMGPWQSTAASSNHWVQVDFPAAAMVARYRVWAAPDASNKDAPVDWELQASSDATSWRIVDKRSNSEPPDTHGLGLTSASLVTLAVPHCEHTVASPAFYRYYRFLATRTSGGGSNLKIGELELVGRK